MCGSRPMASRTTPSGRGPAMWRYWRDLPPRGEISVVFGSWYSDPLRDRLAGDDRQGPLRARARRDQSLRGDAHQRGRAAAQVPAGTFQPRSRSGGWRRWPSGPAAPAGRWRNGPTVKRRGEAAPLVEEMVRRTSTGDAPWIVLPCDDPEYRDLAFGRAVLGSLQAPGAGDTPAAPSVAAGSHPQRRPAQRAGHARPRPEPGQGRLPQAARGGAGAAARAVAAQGVPATGRWWRRSRATTPPARAARSAG